MGRYMNIEERFGGYYPVTLQDYIELYENSLDDIPHMELRLCDGIYAHIDDNWVQFAEWVESSEL